MWNKSRLVLFSITLLGFLCGCSLNYLAKEKHSEKFRDPRLYGLLPAAHAKKETADSQTIVFHEKKQERISKLPPAISKKGNEERIVKKNKTYSAENRNTRRGRTPAKGNFREAFLVVLLILAQLALGIILLVVGLAGGLILVTIFGGVILLALVLGLLQFAFENEKPHDTRDYKRKFRPAVFFQKLERGMKTALPFESDALIGVLVFLLMLGILAVGIWLLVAGITGAIAWMIIVGALLSLAIIFLFIGLFALAFGDRYEPVDTFQQ